MLSLHSLAACLALTGVGQTELLDFTATWCGPCQQMQPVVEGLAAQGYPVRKIDYDQNRDLVARYGVTAVPCFVMLVDGQEVDRAVGAVSRGRLEQMLQHAAGPAPGHAQAAAPRRKNTTFADDAPPVTMRGQSPDAYNGEADAVAEPAAHMPSHVAPQFTPNGHADADLSLPGQISSDPLITSTTTLGQSPERAALAAAGQALAQNNEAADRCLASSVRLKVEDDGGNSVGSGTIIDARGGEALVLTCAHIFRESRGEGCVYVDLFGPGAPKRVPAQVVGYDLKRDVGLVSFQTDAKLVPARLAPPGFAVKRGDAVISVGCDNGREPSVRTSHVTNTDKFLPPPNIQVAGQPVEGRSGGGLFTRDGMVIGVCNAADPADNEGLYAGIGSIYAELERKGLAAMVASSHAPGAFARDMPAMASTMPTPTQRHAGAQTVPTSDAGQRGSLAGQMADTSRETSQQALLDKLQGAGTAEIVCIVRPLSDPHGMSEVLVVDRASPELLRQLAAEGRQRPQRRLTSLETKATPAPQTRAPIPTADSWDPNLGIRRFR